MKHQHGVTEGEIALLQEPWFQWARLSQLRQLVGQFPHKLPNSVSVYLWDKARRGKLMGQLCQKRWQKWPKHATFFTFPSAMLSTALGWRGRRVHWLLNAVADLMFVRYGLHKEAQWDILLGQSLLALTAVEETLKLSLASAYTVTWKGCAALCTDGANTMASNKKGCSLYSSCHTGNKIYPLFHTWGTFSPPEMFFKGFNKRT